MQKAFVWIPFLAILAAGCSSILKQPPEAAVRDSTGEKFAQTWLQEGKQFEKKGDLAEALKKYKLALTVSPSNKTAIEKTRWLEQEIQRVAEKHYKAGLKAKKKGQYNLARRHFLTALRLRPDHGKAREMLTTHSHVEARKYVLHTMKPRESLSMVAKMYYGDYKKFPLIASYNNIEDATKVPIGHRIKVPKIDGIPFLTQEEPVKTPEIKEPLVTDSSEVESQEESPSNLASTESQEESPSDLASTESQEEPVDVVALYRDQGISLFEQKQYEEAIVELKKAFNVNSKDVKTREFLYKSHFNQALALFAKEDYMSAKKAFEMSAAYETDCKPCSEYARKCDEAFMALHYNLGLSYFGKEQLENAIQEWEQVVTIDPNYRDVRKNLQKAGLLLNRLEEIKKSESK